MKESLAVEAQGLSFSYDGAEILCGLFFGLKKGDFTGLIGPNGAGKTTLLRCLTKLLAPKAGSITLLGQDLLRLSPREIAQKVGVVPQIWHAEFAFTVEEVVLMGRLPYLRRFQGETVADRAAAEEAMAQTGILHLAGRAITTLSGGELQRVIIAQALAQSPAVLLLDEPTSHLDLKHQLEITGLIKEIAQRRGMSVFAVFHDLNLAARCCDRLLLMAGGKILADGPPVEVLTPENLVEAYGVEVKVVPEPGSGLPLVVPSTPARTADPAEAAAGADDGRPRGGIVLVLGGARSGKSRFAQEMAAALGGRVAFIATATATDEEMAARIASHQASRPPSWTTVEEPLALAEAVSSW
ncbi:MAG: bifunctional adenosylcobinamide kinase/adenosylcobinamide-phosphate guanylyltransferase, partial [Firmicutes bacterium]|nr:bifunctional adenosylcobinamide kinase/adenosylcobinamide-phosphate guanylyltransferase [Bacillota bacterium]